MAHWFSSIPLWLRIAAPGVTSGCILAALMIRGIVHSLLEDVQALLDLILM